MMGSITLSRLAIKLRRQQPFVQEQVATKALKWPLVAVRARRDKAKTIKVVKRVKCTFTQAAVLLITQFRKPSIARHPGSRSRLFISGNVAFTLTLSSLSLHSAPMCPPCPRSPPAPPPCQTAGVSGSRTGTARITASAALTDAQTHVSGHHSLLRSLRSRHSHSQTTHLASAMVSCSRRLVSDTVSPTLTSLPRHLLSLHPLSLQLRARPRLLSHHHPRQHQHLRPRVPRRDHGRQMSRNCNPNRSYRVSYLIS